VGRREVMAKASESALGNLHAEVAKQLQELLINDPGNLAAINTALKFLKDNRIECDAETLKNSLELVLPTKLPADEDYTNEEKYA
jgi:hypothetical protein